MDADLTDHRDYELGDSARSGPGNSRNGSTGTTVGREIGGVPVDPTDRVGSLEPGLVPKVALRTGGLEER